MTEPSRFYRLMQVMLVTMTLSHSPNGSAANESSNHKKASPSEQAYSKQELPLPLSELQTFTEVMQRIKSAYVKEVDDKTLLESAIKGMLNGLDPHSSYLLPDDYKELEINTSGQFGGLGMEVSMEDGYVKVVAPIDDTPAHKAGIQAGDLIIKLNNKSVKGLTLTQAVEKMRGKPGEGINLTIIRENKSKPFVLTVTREIIKVQSVKVNTLEDGYGYIRISQFQSETDKELVKYIKKLKQDQKDNTLKGLILDLRNNPGGVLQSAVGVADTFLSKGLIVYTQGRIRNSDLRFNATAKDPSEGVPMVVLINGGSASASEIVAGALQDHHRAIIVGSTSFGKGSVQTVLPLSIDNAKGMKLTTALYYTPNGRSIQAEGIKPDISLQSVKVTPLQSNNAGYKEADLKGHLSNASKEAKVITKDEYQQTKNNKQEKIKKLLETDYQLSQALNLVKGMYLNTLKSDLSIEAESSSIK